MGLPRSCVCRTVCVYFSSRGSCVSERRTRMVHVHEGVHWGSVWYVFVGLCVVTRVRVTLQTSTGGRVRGRVGTTLGSDSGIFLGGKPSLSGVDCVLDFSRGKGGSRRKDVGSGRGNTG